MLTNSTLQQLQEELQQLQNDGLYKKERIITTPQGSKINTQEISNVLNFCANNYLGLSSHPEVIDAAKKAMDQFGFGLSSVRFICGTQSIHKTLEKKIAEFVGCEDAILYAAAFDANGGLFEPLLNEEDAIISDELNHASIIDGIRLCKAQRFRYKNNDMHDLEAKLKEASGCRRILIATDGVFSMDGIIAQLDEIVALAKKYQAMVMVDECHASGFLGKTGRGTPEHRNVFGQIDIITGTFGKALGGASGGFTAAKKEIVDLLRQRSRPYLFSNTLAPAITGASLHVLEMLQKDTSIRDRVMSNAAYFRNGMKEAGFTIVDGEHPIVPVMLYEATLAQDFAAQLLTEGIYVIGFFYPVVPKGKARIRVQISAAHSQSDLDHCIQAFTKVGMELGVIK